MISFKIAFRNILAYKLKTTVIGSIIVFGTVLAIVGNSFVDAIASGMKRNLVDSITGDIQIYSSKAKDKLAVFGSHDGNLPDIGHVNDFRKVKNALMSEISNIKTIIPMGGNFAMLNPGNLLDIKIEELRKLYKEKPVQRKRTDALKDHIKAITAGIRDEQKDNRAADLLDTEDKLLKDAPRNLAEAMSETFWHNFDSNYEERCEFLANYVAPLIFDDNMLFLNYIGTIPSKIKEAFSLFEIVKGIEIPAGKRGFLFNDFVYETMVKHRVARRLDWMKKRMEKNHETISATKSLKDAVTANKNQIAEIYSQINPVATAQLVQKLQNLLGSKKPDFKQLLESFLSLTDQNFYDRYHFFYNEIAPNLILYKIMIGDVFPITAFSKSGYPISVNMKVYGTFKYKSFESSPLAGNFNLMDMVSFRELFGFLTAEKKAETEALEKEMGLVPLDRDDIVAMFANPAKTIENTKKEKTSLTTPVTLGNFEQRRKIFDVVYTEDQIENGVFLNAAVVLNNHDEIGATIKQIKAVSEKNGLDVQAVEWKEAAGVVGQLTTIVRTILYLFVFIIFVVATFIIMNSLLMATMERSREIGTMRAIGAQKKFIVALLLRETLILSFVFGTIGTLIGLAIVMAIRKVGVPAQGDVSAFFFSGERLYLSINPVHIAVVFFCMTVVALVSTQYPAWRAMRISPLDAMQKKE